MFVLSTPRANFPRRSRRAQAGATFRWGRALPARLVDHSVRRERVACCLCVECLRDRGSGQRGRAWRLVGAGSASTFAGPPTSAIMTTLPWLIVPGLPGAEPDFHSRRHFLSAAREVPSFQSSLSVARRWRPDEVGLNGRRRSTGPGVGSRFAGTASTASRPTAICRKRRRATLPRSAPPPVPQA